MKPKRRQSRCRARSTWSRPRSMPAAAARASSRNSAPMPRAACASPSPSTKSSAHAKEMLGNTLVTKQTGAAGKQVNRLYIEDGADIARELYLSLLVDRATGRSRLRRLDRRRHGHRGGRARHARKDHHRRHRSGPASRPQTSPKIADALKLEGEAKADAEKLFPILYKAFTDKDMSLLEVNPLIVMKDGHMRVLDAKVSLRQQCARSAIRELQALRDLTEEDAKEIEASQVRPRLCRARRQYRLHGQRRRPCHGDHGHHQALRRRAGELPRRRRRRVARRR